MKTLRKQGQKTAVGLLIAALIYRLGLMIRPEDCAHYNPALRAMRAAEVRHG